MLRLGNWAPINGLKKNMNLKKMKNFEELSFEEMQRVEGDCSH